MKRALIVSCLSLLSASVIACGGSGGTPGTPGPTDDAGSCGATATGTLTINVTGLPAGVDAKVTVTGSGGAQNVTATKTITSLASGSYTVAASTVTQADPIVRKAYKATVSASSATICDGQTASINVTYTLIPTSNKLWWGSANSDADTLGYESAALAATGAPAAKVEAKTPGTLPGAFDKDGNLWTIDGTAGSVGLERYTADSLAASGSVTPDIILTSDALTGGTPGPSSLAFDASGNLWVSVLYSNSVIEIDAAQLAATGTVTPKVAITNVTAPNVIAFDAKGNLWVGNGDGVLEYGAARLTSSTSTAADVSIVAQTPVPVVAPLTDVFGLAFASNDDLWVNFDGTIAKIPSAQLTSGTITPDIQVSADVKAITAGIAFDESGGLWVAYSEGKFGKFTPSQLTVSASVAPAVVVTSSSIGDSGSATSPAFFPAPLSLPLYSALP